MAENEKVLSEEDKSTIDTLIEKHVRVLADKADQNVKIGDLIKLIEIRLKLAPGEEDKKELLRLLEKVRREKLPGAEKTAEQPGTTNRGKNGA